MLRRAWGLKWILYHRICEVYTGIRFSGTGRCGTMMNLVIHNNKGFLEQQEVTCLREVTSLPSGKDTSPYIVYVIGDMCMCERERNLHLH
jgi:hypothetical protein